MNTRTTAAASNFLGCPAYNGEANAAAADSLARAERIITINDRKFRTARARVLRPRPGGWPTKFNSRNRIIAVERPMLT